VVSEWSVAHGPGGFRRSRGASSHLTCIHRFWWRRLIVAPGARMTCNVADTRFTCEGIGPPLLVRDAFEIRGDYGLSKPEPRLRNEPGGAVRRPGRHELPGGLRRGIVRAPGGRRWTGTRPCTPAHECAPDPARPRIRGSQKCGRRFANVQAEAGRGAASRGPYEALIVSTTGSVPAMSGAVTVMGSVLRSSGRTRVVSKVPSGSTGTATCSTTTLPSWVTTMATVA